MSPALRAGDLRLAGDRRGQRFPPLCEGRDAEPAEHAAPAGRPAAEGHALLHEPWRRPFERCAQMIGRR